MAGTNKLDLFYDNDPSRPQITNLTVSENMLNSSKYLSGIRFYSIGDIFNLNITASDLYDNTYTDAQIIVNLQDFAADNITLNHLSPGVSGPTNPPTIGDNFNYNGTFTIINEDIWQSNARAVATAYDPFGSSAPFEAPSNNIMINTLNPASTEIEELFIDEIYRLPPGNYNSPPTNITNVWDSSNVLSNGNAQVWPYLLKYPNTDYTTGYMPAQTANYSGFNGNQTYLRAFRQLNVPHTNAIVKFLNWTVSSWPYSNIILEIKLPGQTGWLRGDRPYNMATFTGADGDGCFVESLSSGNEFYFTFGTYSTANSGYMIIMRITYTAQGNELSYIKIVNWQ